MDQAKADGVLTAGRRFSSLRSLCRDLLSPVLPVPFSTVSKQTTESKPLSPHRAHVRAIDTADVEGTINLLASGFGNQSFWKRALERLSDRPVPPGFPRYGYLLESGNTPVGVILLIFSTSPENEGIRCNVSSWYVNPDFRIYAPMLVLAALKHRGVTYTNITAARHTWPILEAQGYKRYCDGLFIAVPALSACPNGCQVSVLAADLWTDQNLPPSEAELLLAHAKYGSYGLICSSSAERYPFVFAPRRRFGAVPFVQLLYCRDIKDFVRFAGPLGRFLIRQGFPFVVLDSNGPMPELWGFYMHDWPKYYRGGNPPRLGDLAYSEKAIF